MLKTIKEEVLTKEEEEVNKLRIQLNQRYCAQLVAETSKEFTEEESEQVELDRR